MSHDAIAPKVLLNATTLVIGGALQASANCIANALMDSQIDWHFAVSPHVMDQLRKLNQVDLPAERVTVFSETPARSMRARKMLLELERRIKPDLVFTFFGPAYVRFEARHLLGFADGWALHVNRFAYAALPDWCARLKIYALGIYKRYWIKRADAWVVEAESACEQISAITAQPKTRIHIVKNGCRDVFYTLTTRANHIASDEELNLLYVSAYYPHKNFELLPAIVAELVKKLPRRRIRCRITLHENQPEVQRLCELIEQFNVREQFEFLGAVPVAEVHQLYTTAHVALVTTLLEIFSAAYAEAMACGLPVVTTDLPFARYALDDAALYFPPNDAKAAAEQVLCLINEPETLAALISSGHENASQLPAGKAKYQLYVNAIQQELAFIKP